MDNGFISVVMSVYNEKEEWLRTSIESILKQTYREFEFIIVLDNPVNALAERVLEEYKEKDKRIVVIKNNQNMGLVYSLNRAIAVARGEYIARMDADDYARENRLQLQHNCICEKNVDFVISNIDYFYEEEYVEGEKFPAFNNSQLKYLMKKGNISIHPTWFYKKKIHRCIYGYREMQYCEDVDYILRAIQRGFTCYKMSEHLLIYRIRDSGISRANALEQYYNADFLRKKYASGKEIQDIKPRFLGIIDASFSQKEKELYTQADKMMSQFVRRFANKEYVKCIINAMQGVLSNKYYRKLFARNVNYRLSLLKALSWMKTETRVEK